MLASASYTLRVETCARDVTGMVVSWRARKAAGAAPAVNLARAICRWCCESFGR